MSQVTNLFSILQGEIKKHQEIAPNAWRVRVQLYDFPLSFEALCLIMDEYEPSEHKIESLTDDEVTLVIA